jgi:very-short-patch-repair endonuclease
VPHQKITSFTRSAARFMRGHPVDVEKDLWWRLRSRKLCGLKFRRQHPIDRFIADFVCLEARLVIELDDAQHRGSLDDIARTEALARRGFAVLRFDNDRVRVDIDGVCAAISEAAAQRIETITAKEGFRPSCSTFHPSSDPAQSAGSPSPTRGEG